MNDKKEPLYLTFLLFFIALIFRLPGLNRPVIFDEPEALECVSAPFKAIASKLIVNSQPPLYYYVIKLWSIFSSNPAFLRLFTVLLGSALCVILYKTVKMVFSVEAAYCTFILAAFSPQMIFQSQYLRPYCMATLLAALLVYLFLKFKGDNGKGRVLYYFAAFTVLTYLSLYSFYYSVFIIVALNIGAFYLLKNDTPKLLLWIGSQAAAALLFSSWLPFLAMQKLLISKGVICHRLEIENARIGLYLGKIHVGNIMRTMLAYFQFDDVLGQAKRYSAYMGHKWIFIAAAPAFAVSVLLIVPRLIKSMPRSEKIAGASLLFLLLVAVPLLSVIILSVGGDLGLWCSFMVNMRYLSQSAIYALVLFAMLLAGIKKVSWRRGLFSCVAVLFFLLDLNIYQFPSNIYKPAISYLSDKARDCRMVVLIPPNALGFFNTLSDRRFSDYRILKYDDKSKHTEELKKDMERSGKFYLYYLKSAENMALYPGIDSKFEKFAGGIGFVKKDEKKVSDILIISYFERRR